MRKITGVLILAILLNSEFLFSQVTGFPYNEGFEGTFTLGIPSDFIPNWNGNDVETSSRIFREGTNMRTGTGALAVIPISTFSGTIILSLNFSSVAGASANFWARSTQNSTGTRPAIVNFSVSIDGGSVWSIPAQIGTDPTFANANTAYANYTFPFPANTDHLSTVQMRIVVSQGTTGSGTTARFVMDDFSITAGSIGDVTPPTIAAATAIDPSHLDVLFSEPVDQTTSETALNYSVDHAIGNPSSALRDGSDFSLVHLTFTNSFVSDTIYTLTVNNVQDTAANVILSNSTKTFSIDATPPTITSATATLATQLDVLFSEPVDLTTSQVNFNYSVDYSILNPSSAQRDGSNPALVHLTFASSFSGGTTYTLTVNNVKDLANNTIATNSSTTFTYSAPTTPVRGDVVITEFMADPDPPVNSLPNAEYVEIYNRSSKIFDLAGWKISDSGSPHDLTSFILKPDSFLILCSTTYEVAFSSYGSTQGISSFPSLNNTGGDDVIIYDNNSVVIDKVHYDESFYRDASKVNGGWSIERIDPDFICTNDLNWKASVDPSGGTPGRVNSVDGTFSDNTAPKLLRACLDDSLHATLFFSEQIADTALSDILNYSISETDNAHGNPSAAVPSADGMSVTLTLTASAAYGIWTATVSSTVSDCAGNQVSNSTINFATPSPVSPNDILINEVLFSANNGSAEFGEIYNASQKIIDLSTLTINNYSITSMQPNSPQQLSVGCYLLFPGSYLVLSDNAEQIKAHYIALNPDAFLDMAFPDLLTDEDIVVLKSNSAEMIDSLHYYSSWHFPLLNDVHNISLERLNPSRSTNDPQNWHSASENSRFATPGYKNSQYDEGGLGSNEVTVDPEVFSPDNDGKNDVVNILFHFTTPGYLANVKVFDSKGRAVRTLIENELLGNEGTFSWDGVNDSKEKARTGIYVFYIEVFNINGDVKKYKRTCVLATRL